MSKFSGLGLVTEAPSRMTILHPVTRQPLRNAETGEDAWIDMLSGSSSVAKRHERAVTDAQLKMRGGRPTAEKIDADITERVALLTKAWSLVTLEGAAIDVECTTTNARELYSMAELSWLRDQAVEFTGDLGNFQTGASQS